MSNRSATMIAGVLILGLLASCAMKTKGHDPTQEIIPSQIIPTPENTDIAKQTQTVPPVVTSTAIKSATAIEYRCPNNAEVSLADLGLGRQSRLLVHRKGAPLGTNWSLLAPDGSYSDIDLGTELFYRLAFSPDRHWVAYSVPMGTGASYDLWISSIDGNDRWISLADQPRVFKLEWASLNRLVLFEWDTDVWYPSTDSILDPFTSELQELPNIYMDYGLYALSPDASRVIYFSGIPRERALRLHDFASGQEESILPWFDANRIELPYFGRLKWEEQGITIEFMDESVLEIARFQADHLTDPSVAVITIDFDKPSTAWSLHRWSSENGLLAYTRIFGAYETDKSGPRDFFLFDTNSNKLLDFCLENDILPGLIQGSVDGRFLAWDKVREGNEGIIVLDLKTGYWSWISDLNLIGWGELTS